MARQAFYRERYSTTDRAIEKFFSATTTKSERWMRIVEGRRQSYLPSKHLRPGGIRFRRLIRLQRRIRGLD